MPNRILKESICTSDNIDCLSTFAENMFYRLLVNCDDFGRMDARPKILASKLYPLKDVRANQIENALRELASAELVYLYNVGGKPFLQTVTWERHQQIRAKKSKYPSPESNADESEKTAHDIKCNQMISDDSKCPRNPIQSESNPNPNTKGNALASRFTPPTAEEVALFAKENGLTLDPMQFVDFYSAKGWKIGTSPMKDWRAAVRNWVRRDQVGSAPSGKRVGAQQYTQRTYSEGELADEVTNEILREAKGK